MNGYYLLAWSGGKDSAMALQTSLERHASPIVLFTTVTEDYNRIAMHGVRLELLKAQAKALNLPLATVGIPKNCSDETYGLRMKEALLAHKSKGCRGVIFGDLFLESVRKYREQSMAGTGLEVLFPLWGQDTGGLGRRFIRDGFKAVTTCVDSRVLEKRFAGRIYDEELLGELPDGVDPCGENGEFHTFVFDGPIFRQPVSFKKGEVVLREERFYYCDLLPEGETS